MGDFWNTGIFGEKLADDEEWVPGSKLNLFTGRKRQRKVGGVAEVVIDTNPIKDADESYSYLNAPVAKNWWDKPKEEKPFNTPMRIPVSTGKDGQRPKYPPQNTPPQIQGVPDEAPAGFFEYFKKLFGNYGKPMDTADAGQPSNMTMPAPTPMPSPTPTPKPRQPFKWPSLYRDPRTVKKAEPVLMDAPNLLDQEYDEEDEPLPTPSPTPRPTPTPSPTPAPSRWSSWNPFRSKTPPPQQVAAPAEEEDEEEGPYPPPARMPVYGGYQQRPASRKQRIARDKMARQMASQQAYYNGEDEEE